jgi:hypothetical protein
MKKNVVIVLISALFLSTGIIAQEEDLDSMYLSDTPSGQTASGAAWDVYGYLESENVISANPDVDPKDEIVKIETRARINAKYGDNFFYGKAIIDAYFYPYPFDITNPMINAFIDPYEFYIAGGKALQFKIGKQIYNWGVADAFRVTNYMDQRDLTELFFKETDERNRGVYAATLKFLFSDFVIEATAAPAVGPILYPVAGSRWALQPAEVEGIAPQIDFSQMPEIGFENINYAARAGGTISILDFHFSYYNGINNSIVFIPDVVIQMPYKTVQSIIMRPDYKRVQKFGLDVALNISKLSIRVEAVYLPNQNALLSDETETEIIETTAAGKVTLRRKTGEVPYLAYTGGLDYNLWGNNGRVLLEYSNSSYLKDQDLYQEELMTNFLLIGVQDKFFNERLEVKLNGTIRLTSLNPGYIAGGSIAWDFQNGLSATLGTSFFVGGDDDLLKMYENHDMLFLRARMNF